MKDRGLMGIFGTVRIEADVGAELRSVRSMIRYTVS